MATTTIDYTHSDVTNAFPVNGQGATLQNSKNVTCEIHNMMRKYTAPSAIALNKNIAMFRVDEKIRIVGGTLYCDGAVATATADVGFIPLSTLDDAAKSVFGAAVPIATAGAYTLVGGLASGTGVPANLGYEITVPGYITVRTNTAGLAQDDVLILSLDYVKI